MFGDVNELLQRIRPTDLVLDVGGWACPFNRANWVMDGEPFETRGFYGTIGMPSFQGPKEEHFAKDRWVQRDICDHRPWPFADKFFDFSICSHVLEDIRDPLAVCSELIRVSKAGYIEVPSRLSESIRGVEHHGFVGLSHHRWLIEISGNHIQFTPKYHMIHGDFQLSLPLEFNWKLKPEDKIARLFWTNQFIFSETLIHGLDNIHRSLADYVRQYHTYPASRYLLQKMENKGRKTLKGLIRRVRGK